MKYKWYYNQPFKTNSHHFEKKNHKHPNSLAVEQVVFILHCMCNCGSSVWFKRNLECTKLNNTVAQLG